MEEDELQIPGILPREQLLAAQDSALDEANLWEKKRLEGLSPEAATQYVQTFPRLRGQQPGQQPQPQREVGRGTAAVLGGLQGVTFGFGDEISAGIEAALSPRTYDETIREKRSNLAAAREQHPGTMLASEFAGSFLLPGGAARTGINATRAAVGATRGAKTAAAAGQMGRRLSIPQTAVRGAAEGAVTGLGVAEDKGIDDILAGGAAGGVLGGVLPSVARGAKGAVSLAGDLTGVHVPGSAGRRAERLILKNLDEDQTSTGEIRNYLEQINGAPVALADLADENILGLTRAAHTKGGVAKKTTGNILHPRQRGARSRIFKDIQEALGIESQDIHGLEDELIQNRRQKASVLYDDAHRVDSVEDPRLPDIMDHPLFREAYESAPRFAPPGAPPLSKLFDETGQALTDAPDLRTLDYTKRALDNMIEAAQGETSTEYLQSVRDALRNVMTRASDSYAAATANYSGDSGAIRALRDGADFFKADPALLRRHLAEMPDSERELYRLGALNSIITAMSKVSGKRDFFKYLFDEGSDGAYRSQQLEALFGDNVEGFQRFKNALEREGRMSRTKNFVLGGSNTADKGQELEEAFGLPSFLFTDPTSAGGWASLIKGALSGNQRGAQRVGAELGDKLLAGADGDRNALMKVLGDLDSRTIKDRAPGAVSDAGRDAAIITAILELFEQDKN